MFDRRCTSGRPAGRTLILLDLGLPDGDGAS